MVCKNVGTGVGILRRIKPYVPANILISIYNALIQPYFDYCSPFWGVCNKTLRDSLQRFQNRAARIIAGVSYESRSTDVVIDLLIGKIWKQDGTQLRLHFYIKS